MLYSEAWHKLYVLSCVVEGPLFKVLWSSFSAAVLERPLNSRPPTLPPWSVGVTLLLGLNDEEFALPEQEISHTLWQLWQLVMAACWWEHPQTRYQFSYIRAIQRKYEIPVSLAVKERKRELLLPKVKHGTRWVAGQSWKAHKPI